jgi:chromosome partitioning protein
MPKIIAVSSHKGGVGKTTIALNLGFCLSRLGHRVLVIDIDPQGGIAVISNLKKRTTLGFINLLKNNCPIEDALVTTKDQSMALIGLGNLVPDDVLLMEKEALRGNLGRVVRGICEEYDYVFVDTPTGLGGIVTALLTISSSVILPLNCRTITIKTLPAYLKLIQKVKQQLNSQLRLDGIVINMLDTRNRSELALFEEVRDKFPASAFFETTIPLDEHFEMANIRAVPISLLAEESNAARSYMDLAMELKVRELHERTKGTHHEFVEGLF